MLLNELRDLLVLLIELLQLVLARHLKALSALAEDLGGRFVHFQGLVLLLGLVSGRSLLAAALQVGVHHLVGGVLLLVLGLVVDHFH